MKMRMFCLFIITPFIVSNALIAQIPSFQVKIEASPSAGFQKAIINESDDILLLLDESIGFHPSDFIVIPVSGQTGDIDAINLKFHASYPFMVLNAFYQGSRLVLANTHTYISTPAYQVLTSVDLVTGENWSKKMNTGDFFITNLQLDHLGNTILATGVRPTNQPPLFSEKYVIEVYKLDEGGNTIWKNGLSLGGSGYAQGNIASVSKVAENNIGETFISGHFSKDDGFDQGPQFIIKLDAQGQPLKWKRINQFHFYEMIVTDDGIYLWDKVSDICHTAANTYFGNQSSTLLLKLDHDLNLVWAKNYYAENFNYYAASLTKTNTGKLVMAHTTFGSFPAILSELDNSGDIVSQKGYPNFQPNILAMSDGSLVLVSLANPNNNCLSPKRIVAKTDVNGDIAGCPTFATCLNVEEANVSFMDFTIDTITIPDLEDFSGLTLEHFSINVEPFCDYPPVPEPFFAYPDTIFCIGDIGATTNTEGNRLAQAREWQLIGAGIDTLVRDSFEFAYQFNLPGEYLLRQTVWVLGCSKSFEHTFTVLPSLTVAIAADSLLCPDEPQEISAQATRPASYIWNNPTGASGQTLPLTASGTYTVTATDGHCEATDSATITVVAGILGNAAPFQLPPDTTICERDLPFVLAPQSAFSDVFLFENGAVQAASYPLTEAGTYKVGMEAFGCDFQQVFRLAVDCHADVYLPTSFSPNGDGINDTFGPLGTDFEVVELSIYDRWGGLQHKGKIAWDGGRAPKGQAGQGVYAYKLVYRDLLNFETVTRQGEVVLMK